MYKDSMGLTRQRTKQQMSFSGRGTKQKGNELLPGQDIRHIEPSERIVHRVANPIPVKSNGPDKFHVSSSSGPLNNRVIVVAGLIFNHFSEVLGVLA